MRLKISLMVFLLLIILVCIYTASALLIHGNVKLLWKKDNVAEYFGDLLSIDVLRDTNGDGSPDIVVIKGSRLMVLNGKDGSIIWSKNYSTDIINVESLEDDANGDGIEDIIIGLYLNKTNTKVELVSGKDGTKIWDDRLIDLLPYSLLRDVDGDGVKDIAVSYKIRGKNRDGIYVISAKDGSLLWNKSFEGFMHGFYWPASDIDGDGIYDFVISVYNYTNNVGKIFAIRGSDGFVMWSKSFVGDLGWIWVSPKDDFDGDGLPDVHVENNDYTNGTGRVYILRGIDGSTIWSKSYNCEVWEWTIGDANGDGTPDIFLQLRNFTTDHVVKIEVLSGKNGLPIWSKNVNLSYIGWSRDLNEDGCYDILAINLVKMKNEYLCNVTAISGRDGSKLWENTFTVNVTPEWIEARGLADINGDGITDLYLNLLHKLIFINGRNGSEIWDVECTAKKDSVFISLCDFDFNNDGVNDVLVKVGGSIYLFTTEKINAILKPWQRYDKNGDDKIDDSELINAIMDWLNGKITDLDLIEIIQMWLGK